MRSVPHPHGDAPPGLEVVADVLDPVLDRLGFAPGQAGGTAKEGQVIFCRGYEHSTDGACVDLVVDLAARPEWHIIDVRYWGFPSDRWHLGFEPRAPLSAQLTGLAVTLPVSLA